MLPIRKRIRFETLERRHLLTNFSGIISSDTVWSSDMNLTGDVFVRSGARLTIQAGVNVTRASASQDLIISDDGSGASLTSTDALLGVPVTLHETAGGAITGNTISEIMRISGTAASLLSVSANTFNAAPQAHGEFIPRLSANTFAVNSTVGTFGTIEVDTTWPDIPNVNAYQLIADMFVRNGSVLTLASGTTGRSRSSAQDLVVSDDSSGASLIANGATVGFSATTLHESATGSILNSTISGPVQVSGTSASTFDLSGNTFNADPRIQAEYVPRLSNNTFAAASAINVFGLIDTDTTWPVIANVSSYRLINDVQVRGSAELTIATGVTVNSQTISHDLIVADDGSAAGLFADGANLGIDEILFHPSATGNLTNNTIGSFLDIAGTESSTLNVTNNTINTIPRVHAEYVPKLANNSFAAASTIRVHGVIDTDTTWPKVANVNAYELINDVFVRNGSTLTIEEESAVRSQTISHVLLVSDDGSGASIVASNIELGVNETFLFESALGQVTGSTISGTVQIRGTSASTFDFSGNNINVSPRVHVEYVPRMTANDFAAASMIDVFGVVDTDTTWPNIPNVDRYRLIEDVFVHGGSRLTLAGGTAVTSATFTNDLFVSNDGSGAELVASGVNFGMDELFVDASAGGGISGSIFGGVIEIAGTQTSTFAFTGNVINASPRIHSEYVPKLTSNAFVGATVMDVFGNIDGDIVWPNLNGLDQYRLASDIRVTGTGSLQIDRFVEVIAASVNDELFIGDPASVAELEVTGATLGMNIIVFSTSQMTSRFTTFTSTSSLTLNADAVVDIHFNDFAEMLDDSVIAEGDPTKTIDLTNNWWGTIDPTQIEEKVLHQPDSATRPLVLFDPFLLHPLRIPDYLPTSLAVTSSGPIIAGSDIEVSYEIRNDSLTGAGGSQTAALFYLNVNGTQNGAALLDFEAVESLAPDTDTGVRTTTLTLPSADDPIWSNGLPRNYVLSMLVDASDIVDEFIETNNTISIPLFVSPQVLTIAESDGSTVVAEGGENDTLSLALGAIPGADVVVTADPDDQLDLGAGPGNPVDFTFTPANALQPRTLTIDAFDDGTIEGAHTAQIVYSVSSSDDDFDLGEDKSSLVRVIDNDSLKVSETVINDENPQRSTIDRIDVIFNAQVDFQSGSLELLNTTTDTAVPVTFGSAEVVDGRSIVSLNFDPALITDGNYQLKIPSAAVSAGGIALDGDGDGSAGADYVDAFFRFYGDTDGDRDIDGQDYGRFGQTLFKRLGDAGFNPALDSDFDNDVDGQDYGRFGQQLFKRLPA